MAKQRIPRLSDGSLDKIFEEIAGASGTQINCSVSAFGQNIGGVSFPGGARSNGAWAAMVQADAAAVQDVSCNANGIRLTYWRGGTQEPKSAYLDEIEVTAADGGAERIALATKIEALFRPVGPASFGEPTDAVSAMRAIQEATFARLERLHEDISRNSLRHREELDQAFASKVKELEGESQKRALEADAKVKTAQDELAAREEALAERQRQLDDRDNTHARREIRERMLRDVKDRIQRFGVSATTENKRIPVMIGMAVLTTALAAMLWYTGYELSRLDGAFGTTNSKEVEAALSAARWWLWGRLALLSFGLLAAMLYYIRWQNSWAHQHAQAEFGLQQFYIDVNRANWIIESCLEWRKETESAIPTALLESITRGLFTQSEEVNKEAAIHPADQLASALLGTASKLKLKAGDAELEYDKPGKIPKDG